MATLKEHQAAMVDLLANGSGIPASASRLAHAMHDVLEMLQSEREVERCGALIDRLIVEPANPALDINDFIRAIEATTPGLNDKALSKREKAIKTDSPAKWPTPAEQRVKELENTIRQLKANNAKLKHELSQVRAVFTSPEAELEFLAQQEQAGCRKPDTQVCEHLHSHINMMSRTIECPECGTKVAFPVDFDPISYGAKPV